MSSLIKIRFFEVGKWADHPADPIFEVGEGEEKDVSPSLAKVAVEAGKAEFVVSKPESAPEPDAEPEKKTGPKKKPETGPKKKAEA